MKEIAQTMTLQSAECFTLSQSFKMVQEKQRSRKENSGVTLFKTRTQTGKSAACKANTKCTSTRQNHLLR